MKIIVTGGAGFIGSNFIDYWLERHPGDRVVCLDALSYAGRMENLQNAMQSPHFRFVRGDIRDRAAVRRLFEEETPDAVVNFAAESHVDRSIENPGVFLETNVQGAAVLLDACRDFGGLRFHQVSTDEVYGDLPLDRPELRFTEASPLRPSSPYAASKASADLLALAYCRTYGLPVTVSRCSNNYGPRQFPEKLIPRLLLRALSGRELPVYGAGRNVRDWIHVSDHCAAIDRILRGGAPGSVYNVGGDCEVANIDLVREICRMLPVPEERIAFVADRKGHDLRYAIDSSKLRKELNWAPEVNFRDGLRATVEWYLQNRQWWENLPVD